MQQIQYKWTRWKIAELKVVQVLLPFSAKMVAGNWMHFNSYNFQYFKCGQMVPYIYNILTEKTNCSRISSFTKIFWKLLKIRYPQHPFTTVLCGMALSKNTNSEYCLKGTNLTMAVFEVVSSKIATFLSVHDLFWG